MSQKPQEPRKHHFNPVFALQPWATVNSDGRLCAMRKINGNVNPKREYPAATGFLRDLYRTDGVRAEDQQHLEKNFFSPLDNEAASALRRILARERSVWSDTMRSAWTRYLLSLIFRNPTAVALMKQHVSDMWDVGVKDLREHYVERKRAADPDTFEQYMAKTNNAAPHIAASNLMTRFIDSEHLGPTIFNMHWSSIDLSKSSKSLLLSDRPLDRLFGLSNPEAYIALPVSPTMLFLASNNPGLGESVGGENPTKIVKLLNKTVVSKAVEFVWGNDDTQLQFVRRYLGTTPERDIITAEQRDAAIAASRPRAVP